ncbi:adipocyte plasma membrane-associated protein Hemomucin-like isoform X2 [Anopheles moucheti]|uniref:adipocyte plasma membrane-associated protein Hemomucin-like isoform X2 n=1 Tax=Anopheles moucheti TaxID=186751 RepID=UPI0022F1322C|nr:adipocyte plasma membrane-associated protein Hemomucin-like isoform X2 [Anopheles moucheti]
MHHRPLLHTAIAKCVQFCCPAVAVQKVTEQLSHESRPRFQGIVKNRLTSQRKVDSNEKMIAPMYVKGALLVALVALFAVNAVPTTSAAATKFDDALTEDITTQEQPQTTQAPPDDKNTTTPATTTSTTTTTESTTTSSTTTTTPKPTTPTTTSTTTTTVTPPTTPPTTTTTPTTPTPAPTPTSTSTETPTTPAPTPAPHCNRFDAYSFVGGMILAYGSLAISLVLYKFYKTHSNAAGIANNSNNYRTL